ncbi:hypothetical protein ACFFNY_13815 [Paenibacillus hodogayensis]|uniref:Bacterial Pleckstrin homology domain-containing protein n=1 Tax=Paenibacillus hodogayensis TaxID=279208 RepID=A0ABV5VWE3_9BACL
MSIQVNLDKHDIVLHISGLTALANLRKEVRIPYDSIVNVRAEHFEFPWSAVKRTGIAMPNGYKAGHFLHAGQQYFMAYRDADQAVVLDLKGCEFDKAVLQSGESGQLAERIMQHCALT